VGCGSAIRCRHARQPSACGRLVRQGVRSHYRKHRAQTTIRKGVPISTPEETVLDLAAVGVALVDHSWPRRELAQALRRVYEEFRLIIEYDGRQHAEDAQQWLSDIFRREELDQIRWRLVIVTSEGIYREPVRTLERVRDALVECGAGGIRRTFKPEWRLHFPPAKRVSS
jgi:hypothetical protein